MGHPRRPCPTFESVSISCVTLGPVQSCFGGGEGGVFVSLWFVFVFVFFWGGGWGGCLFFYLWGLFSGGKDLYFFLPFLSLLYGGSVGTIPCSSSPGRYHTAMSVKINNYGSTLPGTHGLIINPRTSAVPFSGQAHAILKILNCYSFLWSTPVTPFFLSLWNLVITQYVPLILYITTIT